MKKAVIYEDTIKCSREGFENIYIAKSMLKCIT